MRLKRWKVLILVSVAVGMMLPPAAVLGSHGGLPGGPVNWQSSEWDDTTQQITSTSFVDLLESDIGCYKFRDAPVFPPISAQASVVVQGGPYVLRAVLKVNHGRFATVTPMPPFNAPFAPSPEALAASFGWTANEGDIGPTDKADKVSVVLQMRARQGQPAPVFQRGTLNVLANCLFRDFAPSR